MILIFGILLAIIAVMVYIYGGLRLGESIIDPTVYIIFWVAYIIFGIVIVNIIMLGQFWGVLSLKTGPPGPRGPIGDTGVAGLEGECTMDHNMVFTSKRIKEAIAQLVKDADIEGASEAEVYNPEKLKLANNYLDHRIQMMITSKQYELLLNAPTEITMGGKTRTFGKSLEDLTGYLVGIWSEWISAILATAPADKVLEFLSTVDAQPDIDPVIDAYFRDEVEKYDVWYWGTTRIFRPLKAEVCRRGGIHDPKTGEFVPNTALPIGNRPRLQIREVEYSDLDTSALIETWDDKGLPDAINNPRDWKAQNRGVYGKFANPRAMIPKVIRDGPQVFYPIGQVFVEGKDKLKSGKKRKTLLVSGDVIIPDVYTKTWSDRKDQNILRKGGWGFVDGDRKGQFYRLGSSQPGYVCIGDYFMSNHATQAEIEKKFGVNKAPIRGETALSNYTGIVCVPVDCVEEVPAATEPTWAYQFFNKFYRFGKNMVDLFTGKNPEDTYNIVRGGNSGNKGKRNPALKGTKHYRLKASSLKPSYELDNAKSPDEQYSDLGIGWFGQPLKPNERKYSIFAYLGLMPEGVITHRTSGRKLYIRHYGGVEPNRFVVINWNPAKNDYTEAVKAVASDKAVWADLAMSDDRQQWIVQQDRNELFRLVSVAYPNKFLKLDTRINPNWNRVASPENPEDTSLKHIRPPGISVDHTMILPGLTVARGDLSAGNRVLFFNEPAYGVGESILQDRDAAGIDRSVSQAEQAEQQGRLDRQTDFGFVLKRDKVKDPNTLTYPDDEVKYTEEALLNLRNRNLKGKK